MKRSIKIFLRVLLSVLVLLTTLLVFTQTSIFKSWLRDTILAQVNQNIQGRLTVESLSGNLFTTISLNNLQLAGSGDTVMVIEQIKVNYDFLKLLNKEISVKKFAINKAQIHLHQNSDSSWNISHIFKSSDGTADSEDKSGGDFPFSIHLISGRIDSSRIIIQALSEWLPRHINLQEFTFSGHYATHTLGFEIVTCRLNSDTPELNIENVSFQFLQEQEYYTLKNFTLKTSQNKINLDAESFQLPPQKASLTAEAAPVHWGEFEFLLPELSFRIWPQIKLNADYQSDSLELAIFIKDSIQEAKVEINLGRVSSFFNDQSDSLRYSSRLLFQNIDVSSFYPEFPLDMVLNGGVNLKGRGLALNKARYDIEGDLSRSVLANRPLSTLNFNAVYREGDANLEINIAGESGEYQVLAQVQNLPETPLYSLASRVSNFDYASLFPNDSIQTQISAVIQLEGRALNLENLQARYQLSVFPSTINDFELDTLYSIGRMEGPLIHMDTLLLKTSQMRVEGTGNLNLRENSDLFYQLTIQDLTQFREWVHLDTLEGAGHLTGTLAGTLDSLWTTSIFSFKDIKINGNTAALIKGEGEISIQKGQFWGGTTLTMMKMNIAGTEIDSVQVQTVVLENEVDLDAEIFLPDQITAGLEASILVDSVITMSLRKFFLNLGELAWQGGGPGTEITYDDGKIQISGLSMSNQADSTQKIELNGNFDPEGKQNILLNVTHLDLTTLISYVPLPLNVGGLLDLHLNIGGSAKFPLIDGELAVQDIKIGEYQYRSLTGSIDYQDSLVYLRADLHHEQSSMMWLEGRLPLHMDFKNFNFAVSKDKPVAFQFASDSLKLSALDPDPAKTHNIQGTLLANFTVGNTLNQLSVDGFVKLINATINIPKYGIQYDKINVSIHATDSTLYLDSLVILRNKGVVNADGYIRFSDNLIQGQIFSSLLEFDVKDFYVIKHKDFEILVAGDARVSGSPDSSKMSGGITIKRSSFYTPALLELTGNQSLEEPQRIPLLVQATEPPEELESTAGKGSQKNLNKVEMDQSSSNILNRLSGNLSIYIPRNTWIKGVNWRIELDGNLELIKQNRDFELFGRIGIVRGDYDFLGKRFNIRQGRLDFKGGREINPEISLEASLELRTGDREKREMELFISGETKNPVFRFTLDGREISQADAVSYVVTGRSIDELSYGEQAGLDENSIATDLTSGLLSRQLNQQLGQELNVDYMEIKGKDNWQSATFVVGKYLTNELFVSYQREFGDSNDDDIAPETVTVEYEITRNIFLQVIEGDSKARGFDLIFKVEK